MGCDGLLWITMSQASGPSGGTSGAAVGRIRAEIIMDGETVGRWILEVGNRLFEEVPRESDRAPEESIRKWKGETQIHGPLQYI